ncbi:MAG: bifunctional (p)ppGpp synthetase/guanosine-3',5'-bis(diphosphate) 3'-pyrophosphohydrolase [Sporomusaceae bacterium]|jgi:GTP pyrophosphokinase|nr:bifunctional (p)ppGpp synthetase/guanosine-3',5'-bis(diphosphate) 3'-pyrophosphohydrolase [Sporomusaceae bacterium]
MDNEVQTPREIRTETINKIIENIQSYQTEAPLGVVKKAYEFAEKAHLGQRRASGEDYICHPLEIALILTELKIDAITISAAILHDVLEDTAVTQGELEKEFGGEIVMLVDGVTKLQRRLEYKSKEERQLESYRKMFLAMAKDIRVVIIKLADRLHNMRTLEHMPPRKRQEIARETLEIFAPLANRLGISQTKCELEDLAFKYLEPEKYASLVEQLNKRSDEREQIITDVKKNVSERLQNAGIKAEIQGRAKHFYSIYKKMQKYHKTNINEIYDIFAVRIIVNDLKDCYEVLGIIHSMWKPLPGKFKDYIAQQKSNGYQSLHTTVVGHYEQPVEIQIRTFEMHEISESGIAAHWKYKEGGKGSKDFDSNLAWLRQLLDWHRDVRDAKEFVDNIKQDVFADEVFVFTPTGDVIDLPAGSVPIDFAYRIHTDVGHRCIGARVNRKIVPLEYHLSNGDIVEIITTKHPNGPSRDWLNIVGSSETRNKIRNWFKKERREDNIAKGREMLEKECKKLGYDWKEITGGNRLQETAKKFNIMSEDDLLATLGYGGITLQSVFMKLVEMYKRDLKQVTPPDITAMLAELKPRHARKKSSYGILIKGEAGLSVKLSKCCGPLPGDEIIGYITRGRGISIHRTDCPNVLNNKDEFERIIEANWDLDVDPNAVYKVSIEIQGADRSNLLTDIMLTFSEVKISIVSINARVLKQKTAVIDLDIEVANLTNLEYVMAKLRKIKDIFFVQRITHSG